MTRLLDTLATYVPELIVRHLEKDPTPLTAPASHQIPAAVLFADISGFSLLADELAQAGPDGAEALSEILNGVFSELISLIMALGGDVVTFAGDALVALWPATEEEAAIAIRRAAQCGLALQTLFRSERLLSRGHFAVRMGVGAGEVTLLHIGGVEGHWVWLVTGAPLLQAAQASYQAEPGRVVLSAETWPLVEDQYGGHIYATGSVRLDAIRSYMLPLRSFHPLTVAPEMEEALRAYVPHTVRTRLGAGHESWMGELRHVTVLFVNLPDLYDSTTSLAQAQLAMSVLQQILSCYEGSLNKVSVDEKGATLVAVLGLPPLAHEDDAVRGVQTALTMQAALRTQGMRCAIGITTGQVFCGEVGNEQRREYTILGTVVNLAARLMQFATDSIICDATTYQLAQHRIGFDTLPPISIKSKAEPVVVYHPRNQVAATMQEQRILVGRRAEQQVLATAVQALSGKSGDGEAAVGASAQWSDYIQMHPSPLNPRVIVLEGEAGMGKSHLVDYLREQADQTGIQFLASAGNAIEQTTPYYPWRGLVRQVIGLDIGADLSTQRQQVRTYLTHSPILLPLVPLLSSVLGLDIAENEYTTWMSVAERMQATRDLLVRILRDATKSTPTVLVLEDAQWFDAASWGLILAVSQPCESFLLLLTTRPLNGSSPKDYLEVLQLPHTHHIRLTALSWQDSRRLLSHWLGVSDIPDSLVTLIHEQAQGNPLFSKELMYALYDAGLISVTGGVVRIAPEPELIQALRQSSTVQSVITIRLDRLTLSQQLTLKVASVIGRVFPSEILHAIHPMQLDLQALTDDLESLEHLDLIARDTTASEPAYRFRQVITQEVVYDLMAFAQRRQVHRAVAEWYEQHDPDRIDELAQVLGRHFARADDIRALHYYTRAGDASMRAYYYQEAVSFYDRALDFIGRNPPDPRMNSQVTMQLKNLFLQRGRALELSTRFHDALDNYYAMEELAHQRGDRSLEMSALMARATLYTLPAAATYDPARAQELLEKALSFARKLQDRQAEAKILWNLMLAYSVNQGDPLKAEAYGEQSLLLARELNLREQLAYTLNDLSMSYRTNGKLMRALEALEEARVLWHELGNLPMQTDNLARLSLSYFLSGDLDRAIRMADKACHINYTIGNLLGQANSRFTVGLAYLERGLPGKALSTMEEAVAIGERSGNLIVQVGTRADLGWVYALLGAVEHGVMLAQLALARAEVHIPALRPWALAVLARLYIRNRDFDAAEAVLREDYRDLMRGGNTLLAPMITALATGELAFVKGDYSRVIMVMDDLIAYLKRSEMRAFYLQALLLKSHALLVMEQQDAAYELLKETQYMAEQMGAQFSLWSTLFLLSQIEVQRGHLHLAEQLGQQARMVLEPIIENIDLPSLRAAFLATPVVDMVMRQGKHTETSYPHMSSFVLLDLHRKVLHAT